MKDNSNITQEQLEAIERYTNNTMSGEELLSFEERLQTDVEFKALVDDVQTMLLGIEAQSLKEQLDEFHEELPKTQVIEEPSSKVRSFQFRKIAVAAVLVIALGSFWFLNQNSNSSLYAKYFTPDPGLPTTMSTTKNFEFYDAMVNYKQGDYKIAIKKWEKLSVKAPDNDTLNYFLGVAHLANKNEKTAIGFLEKTTKNPQFILLNDAYFYLGLSYLKKGDIEKAKANLKQSSVESSKELLSKLED